jgi:hypothetical protein
MTAAAQGAWGYEFMKAKEASAFSSDASLMISVLVPPGPEAGLIQAQGPVTRAKTPDSATLVTIASNTHLVRRIPVRTTPLASYGGNRIPRHSHLRQYPFSLFRKGLNSGEGALALNWTGRETAGEGEDGEHSGPGR